MSGLIESESRYPGLPQRELTDSERAARDIFDRLGAKTVPPDYRQWVEFLMTVAWHQGHTTACENMLATLGREP